MAINALIAQGTPALGNSVLEGYYNAQEQQRRNALADQQIASSQANVAYNQQMAQVQAQNAARQQQVFEAEQQQQQDIQHATRFIGAYKAGDTALRALAAREGIDPNELIGNKERLYQESLAMLNPAEYAKSQISPQETPQQKFQNQMKLEEAKAQLNAKYSPKAPVDMRTPQQKIQDDIEKQKAIDANRQTARVQANKPVLASKYKAALDSDEVQAKLVGGLIDQALSEVSAGTSGFAANLNGIKGTPAYDLKKTIESITANVGFNALSEMRQNSPTGGALGNISDRENVLLAAIKGSLDPGQSPARLKANLLKLKANLAELQTLRRARYAQEFGTTKPSSEDSDPLGLLNAAP